MGFWDGVLKIPAILGLLSEGNQFFTGGDGEGAEVLVLCAVLELD